MLRLPAAAAVLAAASLAFAQAGDLTDNPDRGGSVGETPMPTGVPLKAGDPGPHGGTFVAFPFEPHIVEDSLVDLSSLNHDGTAGPLPRVTIDGPHFVEAGGERVKFMGVNICGQASFPDKADAPRIAEQLARLGVNSVRFHHMENTWQPGNIFGPVPNEDTLTIDPVTLDRLDFFIKELTDRGIYINMPLLVSRGFREADGLPAEIAGVGWKRHGTIGFWFDPLRDLQKKYARDLLTHVNPYTGRSYASDPAVAFVEINNENGLIQPFYEGQLVGLPAVFADPLREKWNGWLKAKYADDADLKVAWGERSEPVGENVLPPLAGWHLSEQQGADGTMTETSDGVRVAVDRPGSAGWTLEYVGTGFEVEAGKLYTISIDAKADRERNVKLNVSLNRAPWTSLGVDQSIGLGTDWRTYEFTFTGAADAEDVRFLLGDLSQGDGAAFEFRDAALRPGGEVSVTASLAGTVPLVGEGDLNNAPAAARRDFIEFLYGVSENYWSDMAAFLKDELSVEGIVVPTIVGFEPPRMMAEFGVIDAHGYWAHPAGATWATDWATPPESMVTSETGGSIPGLAFKRVVGMPFMVSEYNHCAPNPHAAESPLMLASYAALQDWDALWLFAWAGEEGGNVTPAIANPFNMGQHPGQLAHLPAASLAFREGRIEPAEGWVTRPMSADIELDLLATVGQPWKSVNLGDLGIDPRQAMVHKVGLTLDGEAEGEASYDGAAGLIDAGSVVWIDGQKPGFRGDGPGISAAVGGFSKVGLGRPTVEFGTRHDPTHDWSSLSYAVLDGTRERPHRRPARRRRRGGEHGHGLPARPANCDGPVGHRPGDGRAVAGDRHAADPRQDARRPPPRPGRPAGRRGGRGRRRRRCDVHNR